MLETKQVLNKLLDRLFNTEVIVVFLIVGVWNAVMSFEWSKEHFPLAVETQLRLYNVVWSLRPVPQYNSTVTLVRIDDALHWGQGICDSPTSRHLLAQLVRNASRVTTKASVIALDVELYVPRGKPAGWRYPVRDTEADELLSAITDAAKVGVTVVVPVGFTKDKSGALTRIPNIFRDDELPLADGYGKCGYPACAVLGSIKLPADKREIPLHETASDWYKGGPVMEVHSLALASADAKTRTHVPPSTKPTVKAAIDNHEVLFGAFLPEQKFTEHEIATHELADGEESALKKCDGNLVLIGGEWHSDQGYGDLVDQHLSPVGHISGLLMHANYIESLLGDHFTEAVPGYAAILIDVLIGLMLYVAFDHAKGWFGRLGVVSLVLLPFVGAYFSLVLFNRYLDFIWPTLLYFVHLAYECLKLLVLRYVKAIRNIRIA